MAKSHGDGAPDLSSLARLGKDVIIEAGVLIFHPENIEIGDDVYVGHNTMLKGYYKNRMKIDMNRLCLLELTKDISHFISQIFIFQAKPHLQFFRRE